MNNEQSYVDDIMGFDPSNLEAFQEKKSSSFSANIYRTNPKDTKADDGHYHSRVKIIYNPFDIKRSIVHQAAYAMTDQEGFFMVKSMLGDGNRDCPIFKSWKKLHFSEDKAKDEWAKKMYDKSESDWCLVQILEDVNQPALVGQIKIMKLPAVVYAKLKAKTNPSADSGKQPVPIMDYLIGLPLDIDVTPGPDDPSHPERKQREISYELCDFDSDYAPIEKIDGTPLFTDEELELIEKFNDAKKKVTKAKTEKAKTDAQKEVTALTNDIRSLYQKALDYLKNDAQVPDLVTECTYQPWTEEETARVQRWIDTVAAMQDPKTTTVAPMPAAAPVDAQAPVAGNEVAEMMGGDVPF